MKREKSEHHPSCGSCGIEPSKKVCVREKGTGGKGCPTLAAAETLRDANAQYQRDEVKEFARQASMQEAECYANRHQKPYIMQPSKTRLVEICEFANKMGYKRLGLAFCIGLHKEAATVQEILETRGFEVLSVACKAGRTPKETIGIQDEEKIYRGTDEAMCNPIFQAKLLNREGSQMNVLLGLCVGHDSLFFKYADAPTTVLAVKDRVTGHNPLAAVYLSESYYRKIRVP